VQAAESAWVSEGLAAHGTLDELFDCSGGRKEDREGVSKGEIVPGMLSFWAVIDARRASFSCWEGATGERRSASKKET